MGRGTMNALRGATADLTRLCQQYGLAKGGVTIYKPGHYEANKNRGEIELHFEHSGDLDFQAAREFQKESQRILDAHFGRLRGVDLDGDVLELGNSYIFYDFISIPPWYNKTRW